MLPFYLLYAVIHEKEKNIPCTLLYQSYGMQTLDAFGSHFRVGDIGLRKKKSKKLKHLKTPKT